MRMRLISGRRRTSSHLTGIYYCLCSRISSKRSREIKMHFLSCRSPNSSK